MSILSDKIDLFFNYFHTVHAASDSSNQRTRKTEWKISQWKILQTTPNACIALRAFVTRHTLPRIPFKPNGTSCRTLFAKRAPYTVATTRTGTRTCRPLQTRPDSSYRMTISTTQELSHSTQSRPHGSTTSQTTSTTMTDPCRPSSIPSATNISGTTQK